MGGGGGGGYNSEVQKIIRILEKRCNQLGVVGREENEEEVNKKSEF